MKLGFRLLSATARFVVITLSLLLGLIFGALVGISILVRTQDAGGLEKVIFALVGFLLVGGLAGALSFFLLRALLVRLLVGAAATA